METRPAATDPSERQRRRLRLARLEADIAYFQARLEMIGEPRTTNQKAHRRAFAVLLKTVSHKAEKARRLEAEPPDAR